MPQARPYRTARLDLPALLAVLSVAVLPPSLMAQQDALYRAVTVRAAPGELLDLIELYQEEMDLAASVGDEPALWMRHSQGDHWDLMLLYPMGPGMAGYYDLERIERRRTTRTASGRTGAELADAILAATIWREEVFVRGPSLEEVRRRWNDAGFFHVEMFQGLPGKRAELVREREMENDYLRRVGRPDNLVFTRVAGAATDAFTIGFYRDLEHFAEPSDASDEEAEAAARAAGFEARDRIGTYLRTLILRHNDTLAVSIS